MNAPKKKSLADEIKEGGLNVIKIVITSIVYPAIILICWRLITYLIYNFSSWLNEKGVIDDIFSKWFEWISSGSTLLLCVIWIVIDLVKSVKLLIETIKEK